MAEELNGTTIAFLVAQEGAEQVEAVLARERADLLLRVGPDRIEIHVSPMSRWGR